MGADREFRLINLNNVGAEVEMEQEGLASM